jgi:GntR family transcriptional regulator
VTWHCEIVPGSSDPIYVQIVSQARKAILTGQLREGDQLPSVRAMAARLLVNPNTVARAYTELSHLGFLEAQGNRGLFVSKRRPILSKEEKLRRLNEAAEQFANQIADLDLSPAEILKRIEQQLEAFQNPEKKS